MTQQVGLCLKKKKHKTLKQKEEWMGQEVQSHNSSAQSRNIGSCTIREELHHFLHLKHVWNARYKS